ncbi:NAD-dependent epimerase/dehydratase family protein [Streptococcus chenjunshii]|uniref:NAD-dependent epimerase/dehydratase family protein n=1 Tax=Streptococcus chenjunshii TaxID=2173853 RepID=A0A372KMZ2_9STRE|nr:NAD(P)H-binding protein [Streptococcus chenjunshii]AXQ78789.1 NAD-dependent epimerase/dehydratase family protein [Streptococcus chenjunshii]RFU51550.1 NAD-dependent epimerase/dehydratase family protein [Streptococcus chenjunshii]RFU53670.1 NAD-dependent epimerase/dehydratase family protein [Streptococcus chenjunshii]
MSNILILGANGQISRLVIQRLLTEDSDHLTLFLRQSFRLKNLAGSDRVTIVEGDIRQLQQLNQAMKNQDIVFLSTVDHDSDNRITKNVIEAMQKNGVNRVIAANVLGIYNEVGGEFGRWNKTTIGKAGLDSARRADDLLLNSGLGYTTLRLPWLNDRAEIKYEVTHKTEPYKGVSGSRQSMADLVVRIIQNPTYLLNDSVGIADPATEGSSRPVY